MKQITKKDISVIVEKILLENNDLFNDVSGYFQDDYGYLATKKTKEGDLIVSLESWVNYRAMDAEGVSSDNPVVSKKMENYKNFAHDNTMELITKEYLDELSDLGYDPDSDWLVSFLEDHGQYDIVEEYDELYKEFLEDSDDGHKLVFNIFDLSGSEICVHIFYLYGNGLNDKEDLVFKREVCINVFRDKDSVRDTLEKEFENIKQEIL